MFNWIFKKIASYVPVQTIDYAKLAEAINIKEIASNFDDMDMALAISAQLSEQNIADLVNLKKLANHIDTSEIASNFDASDIASTIAEEFSASYIAEQFSLSDIAAEISIEDIVAEISIEDIVAGLSSKDIAAEIPTFAVAEDIMRSKEFVKILVKEITDIMIERLTQQEV